MNATLLTRQDSTQKQRKRRNRGAEEPRPTFEVTTLCLHDHGVTSGDQEGGQKCSQTDQICTPHPQPLAPPPRHTGFNLTLASRLSVPSHSFYHSSSPFFPPPLPASAHLSGDTSPPSSRPRGLVLYGGQCNPGLRNLELLSPSIPTIKYKKDV